MRLSDQQIKKIRDARLRSGVSVAYVAKRHKLKYNTFYQWLTGSRPANGFEEPFVNALWEWGVKV